MYLEWIFKVEVSLGHNPKPSTYTHYWFLCILYIGSNELLIKEQRLQQSLNKLNSRLRGNGPGGIKQGNLGSVVNKVCYTC